MSLMTVRNPKRAQRAVPVLNWLTPLGAVVSLVNVAISMCTSEWLTSYERIPLESPNVTQHREDFVVKRTVSGLWTLCHTNASKFYEVYSVYIYPMDEIPFFSKFWHHIMIGMLFT